MKQTIYLSDFRDAFHRFNRQNNFSYEGLEILFNYLEEIESDTGEELELDVIALCCEYYEDSPEDIAKNYDIELPENASEDEIREIVREYLQENTSVVGETSLGFVYAVF